MKNTIKVVAEASWCWMLFQDNEDFILSVLCGSVGIYTRDILLSEAEVASYHQDGITAIEKLAEQVRNHPEAYQPRHLQDFHNNQAAKNAAKEWRNNH